MKKYSMSIIAYCLMPKHYHFLIRQDQDISISKFINTLFNAYVQALNIQIARSGPLFEGRFKHVHVDSEEYLVHLIRYIHLNPVKGNLVRNPKEYHYSNYLEWIGKRNGEIVDHDFINSCFPERLEYEKFVVDYQKGTIDGLDKYLFD